MNRALERRQALREVLEAHGEVEGEVLEQVLDLAVATFTPDLRDLDAYVRADFERAEHRLTEVQRCLPGTLLRVAGEPRGHLVDRALMTLCGYWRTSLHLRDVEIMMGMMEVPEGDANQRRAVVMEKIERVFDENARLKTALDVAERQCRKVQEASDRRRDQVKALQVDKERLRNRIAFALEALEGERDYSPECESVPNPESTSSPAPSSPPGSSSS